MKKNLILFAIYIFLFSTYSKAQPYKNPKLNIDERVSDLLNRMTVEEKVGQLSKELGWDMYSKDATGIGVSSKFKDIIKKRPIGLLWATLRADPWTQKTLETGLSSLEAAMATNALQRYIIENTRLGIPLLLSEEVPHGHMAIGSTVFPTAIGQASTWNPTLIKEMGSVIAKETFAVGGKNGYGPVLDLVRDPRWSRTEEAYGEDYFLISKMGEAMVIGLQGNRLGEENKIISTLKHFVAYGTPEGGHNGGANVIGERELRHHYLKPFEKAVKSGAGSVMTAYNSVDGIPCSSNPLLLNTVLRKNWGFNGFVVSDLLSISGLKSNHGTAHSGTEAAQQSIEAGLDVDLSGIGYGDNLLSAVKQGLVDSRTLDTAVARVLRTKFQLGLFENPYVKENEVRGKVATAAHTAIARKVAQESIVLLKNNNILPLKSNIKRIAVIGPNADNMYNQLGDYTAPQPEGKVVTVLDGIRKAVGSNTVVGYAKGCAIQDTTQTKIDEAVALAQKSDVLVLVMGGSSARDFKTSYQSTGAAEIDSKSLLSDMESGEGFDRSTLDFLGDQMKLLQELKKLGKPMVLVTIKGRPLNLNWAAEHVDALVDAWYPGQEGGHAIADVLFGKYNPAGRLPITVAKSVGQIPLYYNHNKPNHHNYVESDAMPLYEFGYGLSYSEFSYQNMNVSLNEGTEDFECIVDFEVKNISTRDGDEVVQLYIVDETSSVVTAVKQLKAFERKNIKANSTESFRFTLNKEDLKLWAVDNVWKTEKGSFKILVGKSSEKIELSSGFVLSKDYLL